MTQAAQARPPLSAATATRRPAPWTGPLVVGLCFGLAYGLTQRIVSLNVSELIRFGQGFDVQVFPVPASRACGCVSALPHPSCAATWS